MARSRHLESSPSLREEIGLGEEEFAYHKALLEFGEEDVRRLAGLHPNAEAYADQVIDRFYEHLLRFEETRRFFDDPDTITRVKALQREYFSGLTCGSYGVDYARSRLTIGATHERIELPTHAYLGMYNFYLRSVGTRIFEARRDDPEAALDTFLSLSKLIFLDMGLAIESYIGRRENTIRLQQQVMSELAAQLGTQNRDLQERNDELAATNRLLEQAVGQWRQAEEKAQAEARRSATLAEISRIIQDWSFDFQHRFDLIAASVDELIPFDRLSVAIINTDEETYTVLAFAGVPVPGWEAGVSHPLEGSARGSTTANVISSGAPFVACAGTAEELAARYPPASSGILPGLCSMLAVPLIHQGVAFGALHFRSTEPNAYDSQAGGIAEQIASQIAGAIKNADLDAELQVQYTQRSTLAEAGRIISSTGNIDETYPRVAAAIKPLIPFDRIVVSIVDEERGLVTDRYVDGIKPPGGGAGASFTLEGSATWDALQLAEPRIYAWEDGDDLSSFSPEFKHRLDAGLVSAIVVPLFWEERPLGALTIRSKTRDAYSPEHLKFAEEIGAQIAGAIAASELNSKLETQSRERSILAEIGRVITSAADVSGVMETFCGLVHDLVPFDRLAVVDIDAENDIATDLHISGYVHELAAEGQAYRFSTVATFEFMKNERTGFIWDQEDMESFAKGFRDERLRVDLGFKSLMAIPVAWEDRLIGSLNFRSRHPDTYGDEQLRLGGRIADQIAGAFANSKLRAVLQREADEREILANIGRSANVDLDLKQVYETVADSLAGILPFDRLVILLRDEITGSVNIEFIRGLAVEGAELGMPAEPGPDVDRRPDGSRLHGSMSGVEALYPAISATSLQSYAEVVFGDSAAPIGCLSVRSRDFEAYSEGDIDFLKRVADQITPAIRNARNFAATKRLADERAVLAEIGRAVSSRTELASIFETLAGQVRKVIPYDRIVVTEWEEDDVLRRIFVRGIEIPGEGEGDPTVLKIRGGRHSPEALTGFVADGELPYPGEERMARAGLRSWVTAPIGDESDPGGYLSLRSLKENAYSPDDLDLLTRITAQISPAMENARLIAELETRVRERTWQLESTNRELESFSYAVAHDLRAPLRSIHGFASALLEDYRDALDDGAKDYLSRVTASSEQMSDLIDALLSLARLTRAELAPEEIALDEIVMPLVSDLRQAEPERDVEVSVQPGIILLADRRLIGIALQNLIGNAWKFTRNRERARIQIGQEVTENGQACFVRDNGVGFDLEYADRLFGAFQRLHSRRDFEGTGIGLATVQRIVRRHNGVVWADAQVDRGATFYFTIHRLDSNG